MSQKLPTESVDKYHDRSLFPKPSITHVISHHAGTVLAKEPHVKLTVKEQSAFDGVWEEVGGGETLELDDFSKLLGKLGVHLDKVRGRRRGRRGGGRRGGGRGLYGLRWSFLFCSFFPSSKSPSPPLSLFLCVLPIHQDQYIAHVDSHLSHLKISPSSPVSKHDIQHLYCKVYASPGGHGPRLRKAAGRADLAAIRELVARGCDLNTADGSGHTPLHDAAFHGRADAIEQLASLSGKNGGAKLVVDARDNSGWTPLQCAASNGHVDAVKALMVRGGGGVPLCFQHLVAQ